MPKLRRRASAPQASKSETSVAALLSGQQSAPARAGHAGGPRLDPDFEIDAMSVPTFAKRHGISIGTVYNMLADGRGPPLMRLRGRVLITREGAAAWRRRMERDAAQPLNPTRKRGRPPFRLAPEGQEPPPEPTGAEG